MFLWQYIRWSMNYPVWTEKIAHGAGLSALWASWARYVYENNVSRFAQYAVNVWNIEMDFEHTGKDRFGRY